MGITLPLVKDSVLSLTPFLYGKSTNPDQNKLNFLSFSPLRVHIFKLEEKGNICPVLQGGANVYALLQHQKCTPCSLNQQNFRQAVHFFKKNQNHRILRISTQTYFIFVLCKKLPF